MPNVSVLLRCYISRIQFCLLPIHIWSLLISRVQAEPLFIIVGSPSISFVDLGTAVMDQAENNSKKDEFVIVESPISFADDETHIVDQDGRAVYCEVCEMWLNGPEKYKDHRHTKKHKKKLKAHICKA